jgi:hypothetical protein
MFACMLQPASSVAPLYTRQQWGEAGSRQQAAGGRRQAAGRGQRAAGSGQQAAGSRARSAPTKWPSSSSSCICCCRGCRAGSPVQAICSGVRWACKTCSRTVTAYCGLSAMRDHPQQGTTGNGRIPCNHKSAPAQLTPQAYCSPLEATPCSDSSSASIVTASQSQHASSAATCMVPMHEPSRRGLALSLCNMIVRGPHRQRAMVSVTVSVGVPANTRPHFTHFMDGMPRDALG